MAFVSLLPWVNHPRNTVAVIQKTVSSSYLNPVIRRCVSETLQGVPEHNLFYEISALFGFVRDSMRYVHDPEGMEFLQSPVLMCSLLERGEPVSGDCDDHVVLLATLLKSSGYRVRAVIVNTVDSSDNYNHIYLRVYNTDSGLWIPLDPIMKTMPPGWEVPEGKKEEYDL